MTATELSQRCTCSDKYAIAPCPVHKSNALEFGADLHKATQKEQEKIIVTDADIRTGESYGSFSGFIFRCPECQIYSVMVNPDIQICCKCGKHVDVKSDIVTAYVRSLQK